MALYRLTPDQEVLYDAGHWDEWNLLLTINDELDRAGVTEPVAIVAADGLAVLAWLGSARTP
jgi:hypothetical protein